MIAGLNIQLLSLVGGLMIGLYKHNRQREYDLEELRYRVLLKAREQARRASPFIAWTRRIIALSLVGCLVGYPLIAAFCRWPLHVPYIETHGGLISFFKGSFSIQWRTFKDGLTFLPITLTLLSFIAGFYFGSTH